MGKHNQKQVAPQDQCEAQAYNGKERAFKRCSHPKAAGDTHYCTRHKDAASRKHGDWPWVLPLPPQPVPQVLFPAGHALAAAQLGAPATLALPVPLLALCEKPWESMEPPKKKQKTAEGDGKQQAAQQQKGDAKQNGGGKEEKHRGRKMDPKGLADVAALCSPNKKQQTALSEFTDFCQANWHELTELPGIGKPVAADGGQIFVTDVAVVAWLKQLSSALETSTLYGKFSSLKEGFRGLNLTSDVAPFWLESGAAKPPAIMKFFRAEKTASYKGEAPANPKGAITSAEVRDYVLGKISEDRAGQGCQKDIANCFFLWVMSGRAHRLGNIQDTRCSNVGTHLEGAGSTQEENKETPYITLPVTKLLGVMSARQIAQTPLFMKFFLGDCISEYLWAAWMDIIPEEAKGKEDKFFFPFQGAHGFDFNRPMSNDNIKQAILQCAGWHGQPGHVRHDANSIRRGLAQEVVDLVKKALGELNIQHGRGKASTTDLVVYCPKGHLVQPGFLHTDIASIKAAWDACMDSHNTALRSNLLCTICGYPNCQCKKCGLLAAGKPSTHGHDKCWLSSRGPGRKSKAWIAETPDQFQARTDAWMALGIEDVPVFKDGKFIWMA